MSAERETIRIVVDGHVFDVQRKGGGVGWAFDWVSAPGPGYGFSTGQPMVFHAADDDGPPASTMDECAMTAAIRDFLARVDPATGCIE